MLQVKIKCPHCHKPITIREKKSKIDFKVFNEAMESINVAIDNAFKKIFGERK